MSDKGTGSKRVFRSCSGKEGVKMYCGRIERDVLVIAKPKTRAEKNCR